MRPKTSLNAYKTQMMLAASVPNPLLAAAEMHRIQRNADAYARRNGLRRPSGLMRAAVRGARFRR